MQFIGNPLPFSLDNNFKDSAPFDINGFWINVHRMVYCHPFLWIMRKAVLVCAATVQQPIQIKFLKEMYTLTKFSFYGHPSELLPGRHSLTVGL